MKWFARNRRSLGAVLLATSLVLAGLVASTQAAVTITGQTRSLARQHVCVCEGADGRNCICANRAFVVQAAPQPGTDDQFFRDFDDMFHTVEHGGNWNWMGGQGAGALTGTLDISTYQNHLCDDFEHPGHCTHGVEIKMRYTPGAGDPALPADHNRYFIQRVKRSGIGCGGFNYDQIDMRFAEPGELPPYDWNPPPYYPHPQHPTPRPADGHVDLYDWPSAGCQWLGTSCLSPDHVCPAPCNFKAEFWTYICYGTQGSYDPLAPSSGQVLVYEGICWGYQGKCTLGKNRRVGPDAKGNPGAQVHYDPETEALSFTEALIDQLNLDGSLLSDPAFADDPIMGATISVDDLTLFSSDAGTYVFDGGKFRIRKGDVTFLEADMPSLYVDDSAREEFGDTMFGQFANVTFDLSQGSTWLEAYKAFYDQDPSAAEFHACGLTDLSPSIEAGIAYDGEAWVGTSFCPEPATLALVAAGGVMMLVRRRRK